MKDEIRHVPVRLAIVVGGAAGMFIDTFAAGLGDMNDVHPRDKTVFADLAAKAVR